jgi:RimJ/RimL family protein N-acetyltransferase
VYKGLTLNSEKIAGLSAREFTETELHHPDYYSWLREYDNIKYIGRYEYFLNTPFSEIESYVKGLISSNNDCFFAVYYEDEFIGTLKIGHISLYNSIADMGFLIGNKNHAGKGFGTEILRMGCRYAFEQIGLRKLEGGCFASNIAANKMFLNAGFKPEGVLRKKLKLGNIFDDHNLYGLFPEELVL